MSKLAILGGDPIQVEPLPEFNTLGKEEIDAATKVINSGILSGFVANNSEAFNGGKEVIELERLFTYRFNKKYALSYNSATSALHSALVACSIGDKDEVITSPYTMSASATSILMANAKPVFADIEIDNFCINLKHVESLITSKTKAIIAVNIFGQPADLKNLSKICKKHNLYLIEDNSQAPFALCDGEYTGTIGDIGVFSFNRHKAMQCGEGGVALTDNSELHQRMSLQRNHGEAIMPYLSKKDVDKYVDIVGYNYRLTDLQASIAIEQFKKVEDITLHRVELAKYLNEMLSEFNFLTIPSIRKNCTHVYYLYPMLYDQNILGISRDKFAEALAAEGFPVFNYVIPLYRLPLFVALNESEKRYKNEDFSNTEECWKNSMLATNICRWPLNHEYMDKFIMAIRKVKDNAKYLEDLK
ncbi:DegT/DnrJ/EryC1/StrS family aminotransferase [Candidatus Pseudothioglobus singularis]|nr:DegT/DnrJ/EryC1/StrS family aminotransferase [Candidatus Pseudothioglobus singularis]